MSYKEKKLEYEGKVILAEKTAEFLKDAMEDVKESAIQQHEKDKINFAKIYLAVIYIITCKRFTQGKLGAFRMFRFSFRWDHGGNNFYHRSGQWCVRKGRA